MHGSPFLIYTTSRYKYTLFKVIRIRFLTNSFNKTNIRRSRFWLIVYPVNWTLQNCFLLTKQLLALCEIHYTYINWQICRSLRSIGHLGHEKKSEKTITHFNDIDAKKQKQKPINPSLNDKVTTRIVEHLNNNDSCSNSVFSPVRKQNQLTLSL